MELSNLGPGLEPSHWESERRSLSTGKHWRFDMINRCGIGNLGMPSTQIAITKNGILAFNEGRLHSAQFIRRLINLGVALKDLGEAPMQHGKT